MNMAMLVLTYAGYVEYFKNCSNKELAESLAKERNAKLDDQGYDDDAHWFVCDSLVFCHNCGLIGETVGHMGCGYP